MPMLDTVLEYHVVDKIIGTLGQIENPLRVPT
jgi:hypothetical protein